MPTHTGFGSKTNTLLSIGKGFAALHRVDASTERLAEIARRAGTSGGTVNLIDRGGFIVLHQTAVTGYVGADDGSELAFEFILSQAKTLTGKGFCENQDELLLYLSKKNLRALCD